MNTNYFLKNAGIAGVTLSVILTIATLVNEAAGISAKCEAVSEVKNMESCYYAWKRQLPKDHWLVDKFNHELEWQLVDYSIITKNMGFRLEDLVFIDFSDSTMLSKMWEYSRIKDYEQVFEWYDGKDGELRPGSVFQYSLTLDGERIPTWLSEEIFEGMSVSEISDEIWNFAFSYSTNPEVATISEDGLVVCKTPGTATLVIVHNGRMFEKDITVLS